MMDIVVHVALMLVMPPLLLGVINRVKARFAGRTGPPLLQPYYDLAKLLRKGLVISRTTTWIFRAGPVVNLVAIVLAGLLLPFGPFAAPLGFTGDLILFAYLFGLARFFTMSAAMDTGSSFEGMGSAREATFACLSEPALFLAFLVLAKLAYVAKLADPLSRIDPLSLTFMLQAPHTVSLAGLPIASVVLVAIGLFIVLLAEYCRIPVDDPNTHLELTMIHEAMVLDHSGPLFGLVLYGAMVKLFVLSALVVHLIAPYQTPWPMLDWAVFAAEVLALSIVIGVVESVMARLQMRHVPMLLIAACLLCGLGFLMILR
jgi:formate hydrogenlyase subunit 4